MTGQKKASAYGLLAGGWLLVLGSALNWATVSVDLSSLGAGLSSESIGGLSTGGGKSLFVLGVLVAAAGAMRLRGSHSRGEMIGATVLSLLALLIAAQPQRRRWSGWGRNSGY